MTTATLPVTFNKDAFKAWFTDPTRDRDNDYDKHYSQLDGQAGYRLRELVAELTDRPEIWAVDGVTDITISPTADDEGNVDGGMVATWRVGDTFLTSTPVAARDLVDVADENAGVGACDAATQMLSTLAMAINAVTELARTTMRRQTGLTARFTSNEVEHLLRTAADLHNTGAINPENLTDQQADLLQRAGRALDLECGAAPDLDDDPTNDLDCALKTVADLARGIDPSDLSERQHLLIKRVVADHAAETD